MLGEDAFEAELVGDDRTARARDDVRAEPRELSLGEVRILLEQRACDGELEDAVAQEFEALVRVAALRGPGWMRENLGAPPGR
jgi:hypothetical protein